MVVLVLSVLLGPVMGLALPCPVVGSPAAPLELIPRAYLPLVVRPPAVYDLEGTLQDWGWLLETFGPVELHTGTGAAKVIELRAADGYATLIVHVENAYGEPIVGQEVVFYWPDHDPVLPDLPPEKWACGLDWGLVVPTKENGNAELAMGGGSYYNPEDGIAGPHVVWVVREGTDCLRGLGMIMFTDHIHLDSVWRLP